MVRTTVSVVSPGHMGAAVGQVLHRSGVRVMTSVEARSAASVVRADKAGMEAVPIRELVQADYILSIVPPSQAMGLAQQLAPWLSKARKKPVYVDCNATSPETAKAIDRVISDTGAKFVDAGIIGLPPKNGRAAPRFYASGQNANALGALRNHGLDIRIMDGSIGVASALKLSFAGINKGITAVAAAMILAANRAGFRQALRQEIEQNWPDLMELLKRRIVDMPPKAYRWVGEMREIADFVGEDLAAEAIFLGASRLYDQIARDGSDKGEDVAVLKDFFAESESR